MPNPQQLWVNFRKQWRTVANVSTWILSVISTFVTLPSFLEGSWSRFSRFAIAIVLGVFCVLASRRSSKSHTGFWLLITILLFLSGAGIYLLNYRLLDAWTVPYYTGRAVIGTHYTVFANNFREKFKQENGTYPTDERLVFLNQGVEHLWPDEEINDRKRGAAELYVALAILFAGCLMALLQTLSCNAAPVSVATRPRRRNSVQLLLLVFVCITGAWRNVSHAQSYEQVAKEEMALLNKIAQFVTPLTFSEDDGIQSYPQSGITFSTSVLKRIFSQSNVKQKKWIIRFLLAHEDAHQLQFRTYSPEQVNVADAEIGRIKECQADILAAKYFGMSIDEGYAGTNANREFSQAIRDVLEVSFNLGDQERGANHPNREARRTATRLGLARAQYEKIILLPQNVEQFAASTRHMAVVLDIRDQESVMEWSKRLARRIVHYKAEVCNDLAISKIEITYSDKQLETGSATFHINYRNNGSHTLHADMEVQCVTTAALDPNDTSRWQKWTVRNFDFILAPNESFHADGQLTWQQTPDCPNPELIVPVRDDTALLSCVIEQ